MSDTSAADVVSVVSEAFSLPEVSATSRFDDLGVDSVAMLRLMVALHRRFDVVLDVVDMYSVDDVGDLIRLVDERLSIVEGKS